MVHFTGKSAPTDPKIVSIWLLHIFPSTKFLSISFYDEPFLCYEPILWKVHGLTPNDLDIFKTKSILMFTTYTPGAQIFIRFTLWWCGFEIRALFGKSALNDPKWPGHVQGQKCFVHALYTIPPPPNFRPFRSTMSSFWPIPISQKSAPQIDVRWWTWHVQGKKFQHAHMLHTHPRPKFSSVSLYDEMFLSYAPCFRKVHWITPGDLDMFKVKNINMHAKYTPEAQIFVRFALRWDVFELRLNFRLFP